MRLPVTIPPTSNPIRIRKASNSVNLTPPPPPPPQFELEFEVGGQKMSILRTKSAKLDPPTLKSASTEFADPHSRPTFSEFEFELGGEGYGHGQTQDPYGGGFDPMTDMGFGLPYSINL